MATFFLHHVFLLCVWDNVGNHPCSSAYGDEPPMVLMVSVSWACCCGSVECIGSLLCWLDFVHLLLRDKIGGLLPLSATYAGGQASSPNGKVTILGLITKQDLLLSREREFVTRSTTVFY